MVTDPPSDVRTLLLLGAGELGRELALVARSLGIRVVAADEYADAPAMQVANQSEILSLMDAHELEALLHRVSPDLVVPDVEAVQAEKLEELEERGVRVIPNARALRLVARREAMRELAHGEVGIPTPRYSVAHSEEELRAACDTLGYPCVVKPVRSSFGRGQTVVSGAARVPVAWAFARAEPHSGGDSVLVEEYVPFEQEITLLMVREWTGAVQHLPPVGHRQGLGGYQESWSPVDVTAQRLEEARAMGARLVESIGGAGVFGLEFFLTPEAILFSEVSCGPHDTGFVTLTSLKYSQFQYHLRAILGLPLPPPESAGPSASAAILAQGDGRVLGYRGVERALQVEDSDLRIFGKPRAHRFRRMGVALARGESVEQARRRALETASRVELVLGRDDD
ncbi:MAG: formate-dependent phosphoribosylglycinamide formyltransferase [Gemmatimonadota bacterium]